MDTLRKAELYRFPWSLNDNPIGWLEITDVCNIHCKGCYRQTLEGHRPLAELQDEVRMLKEFRNIDNVSIAGGEPLTYPHIEDLVAFIHRLGIKPYLLTNGRAARPEILRTLRRAGMAGLAFHIDMMQKREGWEDKDEVGLLALREECLAAAAPLNIPTSFGITVYRDNYEQIPDLIRWGIKNIKYVHGQTFITYRAALVKPGVRYLVAGREVDMDMDQLGYATDEAPEEFNITANDVYHLLKRHIPGYDAAAYLGGSQRHDSFKWLIGYMVGTPRGYIGPVGPRTVELMQAAHHFLRGTYFAYTRRPNLGRRVFLAALFDPIARRTAARHLANPFRLFQGVYGQSIGVIQAPDVLPDGRADMCDACPDVTVYKGQFVHSCRMDEWRRWGGYATPVQVAEAAAQGSPDNGDGDGRDAPSPSAAPARRQAARQGARGAGRKTKK